MKVDEKALQEASAKLRKLRLTDVGGRKEHPAETVKSVFESGLGGMYDDDAITYALRHGIKYYLAAQQCVRADGLVCTCGDSQKLVMRSMLICENCEKPPAGNA